MTTHWLFVHILSQAHLTTIVQHPEGRALLPRQQPPPTTATDPLPPKTRGGWRREEGIKEGGTDSTSTADSSQAHPRMTVRMKITSETSVKFECSLIGVGHKCTAVLSWPVKVPHGREDVDIVNYQSDVLVDDRKFRNLRLLVKVWNRFSFFFSPRPEGLRVWQEGFPLSCDWNCAVVFWGDLLFSFDGFGYVFWWKTICSIAFSNSLFTPWHWLINFLCHATQNKDNPMLVPVNDQNATPILNHGGLIDVTQTSSSKLQVLRNCNN